MNAFENSLSASPPLRIGFLGTPVFADRILQHILTMPQFKVAFVISQPDRPAGRGKRLAAPPVKQTAEKWGIPVLQPVSIKREKAEVDAFIDSCEPTAGAVVVAYGGLLPPAFLEKMHHRCINVHASLLPRWRGAAPIHRAVMAGDRETGICLMQMEEGLDTGPIFSSVRVPIGPTETTGSLHDRLCQEACTLIASDLALILAGERVPEPQSSVGITYAHKLGRDEGEIDWSCSALEIQRKVLGLSPSPGAFTHLDKERFRILEGLAHDDETPLGLVPGEVIVQDGSPPCLIATGSGTLAPRVVQREGRQPVTIEDLLRGRSLRSGMILGAKAGEGSETSPKSTSSLND